MAHESVKPVLLHNLITNDILSIKSPTGAKQSAQYSRTAFLGERSIGRYVIDLSPEMASSAPVLIFCHVETASMPSAQAVA